MIEWINFFFILFFLSFILMLQNFYSVINLFFFSECLWCLLYLVYLYLGITFDDIVSISFSFFILSFAAVEYTVGFILIISFKEYKSSYLINSTTNNFLQKKKLYNSINSFFWIK